MASFMFNGAKAAVLGGSLAWASGGIDVGIALVDSEAGFVADPATDYLSALGAAELDTDGYARQAITGRAVSRDDVANVARWTASSLVFPALGPALAGPVVGGAVIYRDTGVDATSPLLLWLPWVVGPTNGTDFAVNFAAGGIFALRETA